MKSKLMVLLGVVTILGGTARAAEPVSSEEFSQWKSEMEQKVNALAGEIENRKMGATASEPAYEVRHGLAPAASKVYGSGTGATSVGGYGEMVYQNFSSEKDNGDRSGQKDRLDLLRAIVYVGHKFTDNILFNSELEFEHASTGEGAEERGEVSVEFAYLEFRRNEALGARAGLLLVPVGLVNEMHEPTAFHGVMRPTVERILIPSTWRETGAGLVGRAGPFQYRGYLVAGLDAIANSGPDVEGFEADQPLRGARSGGSNSRAEDFAVTGRVDYDGIPGSIIGVSGYSGKSGQGNIVEGQEVDGNVTLWDAHASAGIGGLEVKALYVRGSITDTALISAANGLTGSDMLGSTFFGGYVELAYDVLPHLGSRQYLAPFVRWERFDTQQGLADGVSDDPANDREELTFGISYKPHPNTVIKADIQNVDNKAGTGVDKFNMGIGYMF